MKRSCAKARRPFQRPNGGRRQHRGPDIAFGLSATRGHSSDQTTQHHQNQRRCRRHRCDVPARRNVRCKNGRGRSDQFPPRHGAGARASCTAYLRQGFGCQYTTEPRRGMPGRDSIPELTACVTRSSIVNEPVVRRGRRFGTQRWSLATLSAPARSARALHPIRPHTAAATSPPTSLEPNGFSAFRDCARLGDWSYSQRLRRCHPFLSAQTQRSRKRPSHDALTARRW